MDADERLALIRLKIERAKKHINDLNDAARVFFDADPNPYVVTGKHDPNTRRWTYYMLSVQPIPVSIAAIAGDVLHNLRSALDHLAYSLVAVRGFVSTAGVPLTDKEIRSISFPIIDTDSPAQYEAARAAKVKGMAQAAIDAIDAIKPYKGGDDTLWRLHKLNNIDKHRLLVTVASGYEAFNIAGMAARAFENDPVFGSFEWAPIWMYPGDRHCPLQEGAELLIDAPDAEFNEKLQFSFEIALNEPQIIECEPILPFLAQTVDYVDNLILGFKPLLA